MGLAAFNRSRRIAAEKLAEEQEEKPLDKMKVEELKEYAVTHDIDLGEATKKPEILAVIIATLGGGENADS